MAVPDVLVLARRMENVKSHRRHGDQGEHHVLQRGRFLRHRKAFGGNGSGVASHDANWANILVQVVTVTLRLSLPFCTFDFTKPKFRNTRLGEKPL